MDTITDRGVSSVIGVVLMVAVTVILAAAVGALAFELAGNEQDPVPRVANADAEFRVTGGTDQFVRITHRGGDTVDVADLAIVVSFSEHPERSRLVGAPTTTIDASDYEGDNVWDGSGGGIGGALADNEPAGSDGKWSAGEPLEFRIASGDVDVNPGETVTVTVVHEPTGKVLLERTLRATTNVLQPAPDLDERSATTGDAVSTVTGEAALVDDQSRLASPSALPPAKVARRTA
jgi:flagellin-like protein